MLGLDRNSDERLLVDSLCRRNTDLRLIGLAEVINTAPKKPTLAVRQLVESMDAMEARILELINKRFETQWENLNSQFSDLQTG